MANGRPKPPNTKPMDDNVTEDPLGGMRGGILGRGMRIRQNPAMAAAKEAAAVRKRNKPQGFR